MMRPGCLLAATVASLPAPAYSKIRQALPQIWIGFLSIFTLSKSRPADMQWQFSWFTTGGLCFLNGASLAQPEDATMTRPTLSTLFISLALAAGFTHAGDDVTIAFQTGSASASFPRCC